jgi:hypothetical protein
LDELNMAAFPVRKQVEKAEMPLQIRLRPQVGGIDAEQVEDEELIPDRFPIQEEIGAGGQRVGDERFGQRHLQAAPIDPGDGGAALLQHEPPAVVLLLHPPEWIRDELPDEVLIDRVQQLRQEAGGLRFTLRVLVWRAIGAGRVALGLFLRDEAVEDLLRLLVTHGSVGFRAGLQRRAAAPEGEGDDETAVCGLDAGLIDLVARTRAVVERDLLHGVLLSWVVLIKKNGPAAMTAGPDVVRGADGVKIGPSFHRTSE